MKQLLESWRRYLVESAVEYSGIIKLKLNQDMVQRVIGLQSAIEDSDAIALAEHRLHVTLVHQSFMKPHKERLKTMELPDGPEPILDEEKGVFIKEVAGKKTWAIELKNQDEMKRYVVNLLELLGDSNTDPEPERVFHISLANLTGNPGDSVR